MDLVRDILDARLVDREGRGLGRVDGIVLRLRDGRPPEFVAMEVGLMTSARRVHRALPGLLRRLTRSIRRLVRTVRYPPRLFRDIGTDIELDVVATNPRVLRFEKWLRRTVVARLPGGKL
jgi:hypothetical protein